MPIFRSLQLLLVGGVALFASVLGGLAGYGTGALMPLVLVPLIGAEPVVPIIAISAIFTNLGRTAAYLRYADRRRALIVILAAARDDGARRLRLYTAEQRRRGAGDRRHADVRACRCVGWRRRRDIRIGDAGLALARSVMASWSAAPRVRA